MSWEKNILDASFEEANSSLEREAMTHLRQAISNNLNEDDFYPLLDNDLTYKNRLKIIVKGYPGFPAFEFEINIFKDGMKIGQYRYISDLNFNFVDEFLVVP